MPEKDYTVQITNDIMKSGINIDLLKKFDDESRLNGKRPATRHRLIKTASKFAVHINKPLKDATKDDVVDWLKTFEHLKESSRFQYIANIRVFFKWLDGGEDYPECIKWLKVKQPKNKREIMTVLTPDDVLKMAEVCKSQRDRALVMVLFDSGARVGEVVNMSIRDVTIDSYGGVAMITGKTGMRRIRLIDSVPDLQLWMSMHPQKDDPNAPVWYSQKRGALSTAQVYTISKRAGKSAGISIKTNPHLLRHSRLTLLAQHLTDAELRVFAGWEAGSEQSRTYVHLSGADIDDKLLKIGGVKAEDMQTETATATTPKDCPRCKTRNPPTAKYCYKCGAFLDLKTALDAEQVRTDAMTRLMEIITKNPEVLEELKNGIVPMDAPDGAQRCA